MYTGEIIFSQVMEHLPLHVFHQCVARYHGDFKVREFSCLDQYLCMAFAQLTYRESLRDIEACLSAQKNKLYHMGIRSSVSRNNLANANKIRDWRIYADLLGAFWIDQDPDAPKEAPKLSEFQHIKADVSGQQKKKKP